MTAASLSSSHDPEWLRAVIPLGLAQEGQRWLPRGLGTLVLQPPVLWLVTTRGVLDSAQGVPLLALVDDGGDGAVIDLTSDRAGTPTDWILDPDDDLAVSIFPVSPKFRIKAFALNACLPFAQLSPLLPVSSIGCPYGVADEPGLDQPRPFVFPGAVARVDPERRVFYTDAPLLPSNVGAPLVTPLPADAGGGVAFTGVASGVLVIPEPGGSPRPPRTLTRAISSAAALALLDSEPARAQRELAAKLESPPAGHDA